MVGGVVVLGVCVWLVVGEVVVFGAVVVVWCVFSMLFCFRGKRWCGGWVG